MAKSLFLDGLECIVDGFVRVLVVSVVLMFFGWLVTQVLDYVGGVVVVVFAVVVLVALVVILVVWFFYCKYYGVDCGDCSEYVMCFDGGVFFG